MIVFSGFLGEKAKIFSADPYGGFFILCPEGRAVLSQMNEADSLFARNRAARLDHLTDSYRGAFDSEAMHTLLSDHGEREDGTFMRSMCMHPKHAAGKQTCASMIALPGQRTMRFYDPNPCKEKMKEYRL